MRNAVTKVRGASSIMLNEPARVVTDTSELRWFVSGAERGDLFGQTTVPGTEVEKGQSWYFSVLPNDGTDTGPLVASATVTIVNTPPVANAGDDAEVVERRTIMLDGSASSDIDPQDLLTFTWTQVDNGSVPITVLMW